MINILWVSDEPDWAFDVNAKALSSNMPQYKHHFIYTCQKGREAVDAIMDDMDIIVAMNPVGFYMYSKFDKVISVLDSVRAVNDSQNSETFQKVAGIICNNEFLFDYAKKKNNNVILQPNGLDLERYFPKPVIRQFTVGFAGHTAGSYAHYKGWTFYDEAMKSLGDKVGRVDVLYQSSRIPSDRMVPDFYHKIDCLVLPSINEGCSNVITEALACGVPVLCTKIGYHGHSLMHERDCFFIERNATSIKKAIEKLESSPILLSIMRRTARDFACQNHDIKKVAQNYADFFEKAL